MTKEATHWIIKTNFLQKKCYWSSIATKQIYSSVKAPQNPNSFDILLSIFVLVSIELLFCSIFFALPALVLLSLGSHHLEDLPLVFSVVLVSGLSFWFFLVSWCPIYDFETSGIHYMPNLFFIHELWMVFHYFP